jgi:hypothetical protein
MTSSIAKVPMQHMSIHSKATVYFLLGVLCKGPSGADLCLLLVLRWHDKYDFPFFLFNVGKGLQGNKNTCRKQVQLSNWKWAIKMVRFTIFWVKSQEMSRKGNFLYRPRDKTA